jgi:hypothetical protein
MTAPLEPTLAPRPLSALIASLARPLPTLHPLIASPAHLENSALKEALAVLTASQESFLVAFALVSARTAKLESTSPIPVNRRAMSVPLVLPERGLQLVPPVDLVFTSTAPLVLTLALSAPVENSKTTSEAPTMMSPTALIVHPDHTPRPDLVSARRRASLERTLSLLPSDAASVPRVSSAAQVA